MSEFYFKIKHGYGKGEFEVVKAGPDLERVIYAWIEQIPVTIGGKMIHGKMILTIEPYYNKHTGWNRLYEPIEHDDWEQIKRDCPDYDGVLGEYKDHVQMLISSGNTALIGSETHTLKLTGKKDKYIA